MTARVDPAECADRIGETTTRRYGPISRWEVRRYARAVEDDNPLFHDVAAARDRGFDDLVVPPNYLPAIVGYGEGPPAETLREDGIDPATFPFELPPDTVLLGGGQELAFDRYVTAGESIEIRETTTDVYQRQSDRMGTLTFVETDVEFLAGGERVLACHETRIVGDRP